MNKEARINNLWPHYSNEQFKHPQTTYLAYGKRLGKNGYVKGAKYSYSDRIREWGYDKADKAWETAKKSSFEPYSAAFHEIYLKAYWGKDLELVHILSSFNWATGYPYVIYGVIFKA